MQANDLLDRIAQNFAQDMIARNFYSHTDPDGHRALERVLAGGYNAKYVGENIACWQMTVEDVMRAWLESPEHRENILNENFNEIGIGFAAQETSEGPKVYWVQNFAG